MKKNYFKFLVLTLCMLVSFVSSFALENIKVGTTTRTMLVYAPKSIVSNRPLVISMHGSSQDANYQQSKALWESIADTAKFVVVYPNGVNNSWDLGGTSDTNFLLAIIDTMANRYKIDRNRVYLSGFSMGGMMTYYAATKIANKIAAFAPVSAYLMGGPNTGSSRPIPIIHTHGTTDDVVVYSGVQASINAWVTRNGCSTTAVVTSPYPTNKPTSVCTKYYYGFGVNGVEITLMSLKDKGHWYSMDIANGINTSLEIWNFAKRYSLIMGSISSTISALAGFTYVQTEGLSNTKSFTISGSSLNNQVLITAPTNFEVSLNSETGYSSFITITPITNAVASTTVYVRMKSGLTATTYTGNLTVISIGATGKKITLAGTVLPASTDVISTYNSSAEVVKKEYYTLTSKKVNNIKTSNGIFIEKKYLSDGSVIVSKIFLNNKQ
jgi:poly(3-hydroxybutyrate) depolymerase